MLLLVQASDTASLPAEDGEEEGVVNVDGERSLILVRASKGSADASIGGPHLSASVAIGAFEIEDLLASARCRSHRYLARSFPADPGATLVYFFCPALEKQFCTVLLAYEYACPALRLAPAVLIEP